MTSSMVVFSLLECILERITQAVRLIWRYWPSSDSCVTAWIAKSAKAKTTKILIVRL